MNVQRLRGNRKQRMGGFCLHKLKKNPRESWFLNEAARFVVGDCAKCIACGLVKMKMKAQHRRDPFLMPHLSTFLLSFSRHRKYKKFEALTTILLFCSAACPACRPTDTLFSCAAARVISLLYMDQKMLCCEYIADLEPFKFMWESNWICFAPHLWFFMNQNFPI